MNKGKSFLASEKSSSWCCTKNYETNLIGVNWI